MKKQIKLFLSIFMIGLLFQSCTKVSPGARGVKVNQWGTNKGIMEVSECTGFVWYNPMKYDIYEIPTTIQHKEYNGEEGFTVNSSDGAEFHVNPIINYYINGDKASSIVQNYYPNVEVEQLERGFIKVAVYDAFRIATNSYKADSLISHRQTYEQVVRKLLDNELNKNGFLISQFTSNLIYPQTFKAAIESKNSMVQEALKAENAVKLAEANAKIQIAKSEGNAQSLKIQADADAYANRVRQVSLTPLLIQQQFLEKWDGVLPTYGVTPQLFKDITK
jgi:regulator of protease activity HflC (stomatin/prohibitin superfamily)